VRKEIPADLLKAVLAHNAEQNGLKRDGLKRVTTKYPSCAGNDEKFAAGNLLLPMAFPEGSPMHASYGAGHATVAGGCVTMLKAFFEMFETCDSGTLRKLKTPAGDSIHYEPSEDGKVLCPAAKSKGALTIQGELDKLAANISIGRNMAGVHYYSDYYDSLRMGERIAVGILMEQAPTYGDYVESTFDSFDGDRITISGEAGSRPSLSVMDSKGSPIRPADWWLRHVSGQEFSEDL